MITEEMLKQAAAELADAINESLPAPEESTHQFPDEFEKKIRNLNRKANHPILYRTLRNVASIILILTLGFGSVLTVSVEAREIVFGWIRQQYESFYEYFFSGESQNTESTRYTPGWVPEGFEFDTSYEIPDGEVYVFTNAQETIIQFTYTKSVEGTSLFVDTVEYEQHDVLVNDNSATVYLALNDQETNAIIWTDAGQETLFYISAPLCEEDLIKMAENIIVKK